MVGWRKQSAAIGSGTPDPSMDAAATQPVPSPIVANKPAPGLTGPKGLAPRTSYSRVNTGAPPTPDAGASGQKASQPRGLEFLPTKVAHKEKISMTTTMMQRPNLHDLIKEAMEGTASKVDISAEAMRQLENVGATTLAHTKTASAAPAQSSRVPTEYLHKLAGALDHMVKTASEGTTTIQPGKGPNALEVLETTSAGENVDVNMGGARAKIPTSPAMESSGVAKDPANAMATNATMSHPEQPEDPMHNEKSAAALYAKNLAVFGIKTAADKDDKSKTLSTGEKVLSGVLGGAGAYMGARDARAEGKSALKGGAIGALKGVPGGLVGSMAGGQAGHHIGKAVGGDKGALVGQLLGGVAGQTAGQIGSYKLLSGKKKEASILERNLAVMGIAKQAEDAINPAQISAGKTETGATPPEGVSASEEAGPSEPSDVNSQKSMISSNEAAINYTRRQAKADPKKDAGHLLNEPALSASTDTVLNEAFDHTSQAGAKIASSRMRTAAAQALLSKLAEDAKGDAKKKEKLSQGLGTPAGQSGFNAGAMGPSGM